MALTEEKIACSKCSKGHAAYVPYCPYCGAMQPSKSEQQDKEAKPEQKKPAEEQPPLGFELTPKPTGDTGQAKADHIEQQRGAEQAAVENQIDSTANQSAPNVGERQDIGAALNTTIVVPKPPGGNKKMAIILLSLAGLAVVGFWASLASKSQRDGGQASPPVQPVPMPTSPVPKQKPLQQAISAPTKTKSEPQQQVISIPINKLVLGKYDMLLNPTIIYRGGSVVTESKIGLIGNSHSTPRVEEMLVLVMPNGRESFSAQSARVQAINGAGTYMTTAKLNIPLGFDPGSYTVKSTLYLDGEAVANRQANFQIAPDGGNSPQLVQPRTNEKVIQLINDAKKFIAQGNYKQAEESMKFCLMLESEDQVCQQIKQKAAQLNDKMFDCVGSGKEWVDGRCN